MTAPVLPYMAVPIRAYLMADTAFNDACLGRCSTRAPADVTSPYATVAATANPIEPSAGVWSPMVQVDGWCPKAGYAGEDPEAVVWRIAAAAAARLSVARNVEHGGIFYSARVTDGPLPGVDTSRGEDAPLYRALIRAEITVHAH